MSAFPERIFPLQLKDGRALLVAGLVGVLGATAFTFTAYVLSPAALPLALVVGGYVAVTAVRPVWGVAGALLMIPLEAFSVEFLTGEVSPSQAALAVVGALWLVRFVARPSSVAKPRPRDWPIFVLAAAMTLGLTVTTDPAAAARTLAALCLSYGVFLEVQRFSAREIAATLTAFIVGAGVLGAIGAVSYLQETAAPGVDTTVRAVGTFEHPNQFGSMLNFALLPAVALALGDLKRHWWLLVGVAGALVGLLFSLSRAAITGFACGMLLLLLSRRARWVAIGLTLLIVGLTIAQANPIPGSDQLQTVEERLSTLEDPETEVEDRPAIWSAAIDVAVEHPLVGIGVGEFENEAAQRGLFGGGGGPYSNAHNLFLQVAAELGLLALIALVVFLGQLIARGAGALRRPPDRLSGILALGLLAALLAYLVQAITLAQLASPNLAAVFFVFAGMVTAVGDRSRSAGTGASA